MKPIILSLLSVTVLCSMPQFAQSQSTVEFQSGTHIEVTTGADICADNVIISGTNSWTGTQCGGPLVKVKEIEDAFVPRELTLSQNFPNPFNPTTTIEFTIPEDGRVLLKLYDITGRELVTLLDEEKPAGYYHQVTIDASRFVSGTYFCRLEFTGKQLTRKIALVR